MEPDHIGLEGGLNPYIYADGNPVSNVEPSGLEAIRWGTFGEAFSSISKSTATRTAFGWGGALLEPSPFGEAIMGVATVGVFGYEGYKYYTESEVQSDVTNNLKRENQDPTIYYH